MNPIPVGMFKVIALALGGELDGTSNVVVQGERHTLTISQMGPNTISLLVTADSVVSAPLIQLPCVEGFSINHVDGSVTFTSSFRDLFETKARVARDGTFTVIGPEYRIVEKTEN